MMYFMHIGGDQDIAECFVHGFRQIDIGMGKGRGQHHQCLINHDSIHGCAGNQDQQHKEDTAEQTVTRMMAKAGGYIHIGIAVMDEVKAPEVFVLVHHQVDQPAAEIEG